MQIFSRHALVTGRLDESEPAVLLEGSWPDERDAELRHALDDAIDARFRWIDGEAARIAGQIGATAASHASLVSLNSARLRYQLVKWLRVVAWFEKVARLPRDTHLRAILERDRDADYGRLLQALADKLGHHLLIRWEASPTANGAPAEGAPPNAWWRRVLSCLHRATDVARTVRSGEPRVLLCGNPRHLDPLCRELLRRGARPWWLYERFALGAWLRWRVRGVGQAVCDREFDAVEPLPLGVDHAAIESCGLDWRPIMQPWLEQLSATSAPRQSQLAAQIEQALDTIRPHSVIVDQDATPFNRALVYAAKSRGIGTWVAQHGVPFVPFGFAPVEADAIGTWGATSRQQLVDWGVSAEQIHITGSPAHDRQRPLTTLHSSLPTSAPRPPRFLLLATVPPQDARPDLIGYHCTTQSYEQMLRTALAVLNQYDEATVLIKPHPRDASRRLWHRLLNDFPALDALLLEKGAVEQYTAGADCVLSCASSSGVEATLSGVPVVQLMPPGSCDLIDAEAWGMLGTARSAEQLRTLIDRALYDPKARDTHRLNPSVLGEQPRSSAEQFVELVLNHDPRASRSPVETLSSVT